MCTYALLFNLWAPLSYFHIIAFQLDLFFPLLEAPPFQSLFLILIWCLKEKATSIISSTIFSTPTGNIRLVQIWEPPPTAAIFHFFLNNNSALYLMKINEIQFFWIPVIWHPCFGTRVLQWCTYVPCTVLENGVFSRTILLLTAFYVFKSAHLWSCSTQGRETNLARGIFTATWCPGHDSMSRKIWKVGWPAFVWFLWSLVPLQTPLAQDDHETNSIDYSIMELVGSL